MGAIEFIDGFDEYAAAQAQAYGWPAGFTSMATGRFGTGQCMRISNLSQLLYVTPDARYSIGFAMNMGSANGLTTSHPNFIRFFESGTVHGYLAYNGDGTLSVKNNAGVLATSAAVITNASAWYHVEFDYNVHDSTGSYEVRVDGVSVIGPTSNVDTQNGGTGVINQVGLTLATVTAGSIGFDDLIITKGGGFNGDCRVVTQFPSADGANTAWSRVSLPRFQAAGTGVGGQGDISPAWPAHEVGDIGLLFVEACGGQAIALGAAEGFTQVANSPQNTGTTTNGTRLAVYWCRATSSAMPAPLVTDPGDHAYARILTFRGCLESGDPIDITGGGVKAAASTSVTATGVTTTQANDLVIVAVSWDVDATTMGFSNWANTNLDGLTMISHEGTTQGNGGGVAIAAGIKAADGATGDTTVSMTSAINAFLTIALKTGTADYTAVDDPLSVPGYDSESSYLYSGTPNDRETFDFPAIGVTGTVKALAVRHVSRKDDAGSRKIATVVRQDSTNYDKTAVPLSAAYVAMEQVWATDPDTETAWTTSGVDTAEFGVKVE